MSSTQSPRRALNRVNSYNMYQSIKISEFLHRRKEKVSIDPEVEYSLVTVKLHHKGVVLREKKKGSFLGSSMYRISEGQFILSGIDARNGAFGIVPPELDGAIITNDFWCFDIDESRVKRDFFYWLTNTPLFQDACDKSSKGETQRIRLQKDLFLNFEFHFPPIEKQEEFLHTFEKINVALTALTLEHNDQSSYLSLLRQSILQEAIEGKLTAEWRKEQEELLAKTAKETKKDLGELRALRENDPEFSATALLAKIREEKESLTKTTKRAKREKELTPIKPEEVPFDLPEGWVWTRLGEISVTLSTGPFGSMLHKSDYVKMGIPIVNPMNIINGKIEADSRMLISESTRERLKRYCLKENDIVIARRGNLEKCAVVSKDQADWLCGTGSFFLRISTINIPFFLLLYRTKYSQNYLLQDSIGQTMDNLNQTLLHKLPVSLPPIAEQQAIVERVDRLLAMVDDLEQQVAERKLQADELMQAVLREAFEGTKPVTVKQDSAVAEEEPVSLSLETAQELTSFQKMQILGSVIQILEEHRQHQGEMILAKYLYLLHHIYKINAGFQFKKWHFGPYDPEIKKVSNNKGFFRKTGRAGYETISVLNKDKLFKYDNRVVDRIKEVLPPIVSTFGKYKDPGVRSHKIELLASVLKVMEDSGKSDLESVYYELARWTTDAEKTGFTSKAEKFSEEEVRKVLGFIGEKGWV